MLNKCNHCGKPIPKRPGSKGANNQKYCNITCRNKAIYIRRGGAETQSKYLYDKRLFKYGKENLVQCKICGKWFRQVGSHIVEKHGITAREYREAYGFDVKRGQLPPDLKELKAEQALELGGVKNLKKGQKFWFRKGQKGVGVYTRSPQTMARLRNMQHLYRKKGGVV